MLNYFLPKVSVKIAEERYLQKDRLSTCDRDF